MSFTKLDNNGNDLPDDAEDWLMVRDNVTGLIWEIKQAKDGVQNYENPNDADNTYTWYDTNIANNLGYTGHYNDGKNTQTFIEQLNQKQLGGFNDWRMPSPKELASITDLSKVGKVGQAIDIIFFPASIFEFYWSSTSNPTFTASARKVNFSNGYENIDDKLALYYVRAVRGGQCWSFDSFVINDDHTITDIASGIMWERGTSDASQTWQYAIDYCENLSIAMYTDWRLPEQKELISIVDYSRISPSINSVFVPHTMANEYWSSTKNPLYYGIDFENGLTQVGIDIQNSKFFYVRAVRGGQNRQPGHLFIITPLQSSFWKLGRTMSITWESQNIPGNVTISLSKDGGREGTYEIIAETENDGSYDWQVTGDISVNCMLKIEPLNEPDKGTRQGLFSIYPYTPEKYQQIILRPATTTIAENTPVTITANYSTSDNAKTRGIGVRFHYDTSKLMFMGFHSVSLTPSVIEQTPLDDIGDYDNDPSTDKYLLLQWSSPKMDWPENVMALKLADLNFIPQSSGQGNINISFLEVSYGYVGQSKKCHNHY
ncbi:MAG: hypothetical protein OMM_05555 [Candidatus Magnetoglobus multicellularis str. Araruama]|uniref:Lcl C-terminal domain-containing protein n=1 Tax=Candidatus Magnetoglobus multicellularis str. Araruama TaxID=890399 RepID=A0A1V1NVK9_9BACT|nr:MAG: hypothetical protein OMM_05555 [Candidatus Magnetoglobus multicellularis str. Araruama]